MTRLEAKSFRQDYGLCTNLTRHGVSVSGDMNALSGLAQVQSRACYLVVHSHYKREEAEKGSSVAISSLRKHSMGTGWGGSVGEGPHDEGRTAFCSPREL